MYKFFLLYYSVVFFSSCIHEPTGTPGTEESNVRKQSKNADLKNAYKYHNLFTLEGIQKIKNPGTFPYVNIDKIKDTFKLSYNLSFDSVYKTIYVKKRGYLFRTYKHEIGMTTLMYEEYIKPNMIITFQYDESAQLNALASISVFEKNKIQTYVLDQPVVKRLDIDSALKFIGKKKMFSITEMQFSNKKDSVFINRNFKNIRYPYLSNTESLFFKNNFESLECWMIYAWHYYDASLVFDDEKLYYLK